MSAISARIFDDSIPITRCGDVAGGHWEVVAVLRRDGLLRATHLHAWHGFSTSPFRLETGTELFEDEIALQHAMAKAAESFFEDLRQRTARHLETSILTVRHGRHAVCV